MVWTPAAPSIIQRRSFIVGAASTLFLGAVSHTALAAKIGSILNDGAAAAITGSIQFSSLLNGYAKRPPWRVAGIDYGVGIQQGLGLTPASSLTNNANISITGNVVTIIGTGFNLNGIDFTVGTGWQLSIGANNVLVTNCKFLLQNTGPMPFQFGAGTNFSVTVQNCDFSGNDINNTDTSTTTNTITASPPAGPDLTFTTASSGKNFRVNDAMSAIDLVGSIYLSGFVKSYSGSPNATLVMTSPYTIQSGSGSSSSWKLVDCSISNDANHEEILLCQPDNNIGTATFKYNYIHDGARLVRMCGIGTAPVQITFLYNVISNAGMGGAYAHGDWFQIIGGNTMFFTFNFNTCLQTVLPAGGGTIGVWGGTNNAPGNANPTFWDMSVQNNTMIATVGTAGIVAGLAGVNPAIQVEQGQSFGRSVVANNYVDPTGMFDAGHSNGKFLVVSRNAGAQPPITFLAAPCYVFRNFNMLDGSLQTGPVTSLGNWTGAFIDSYSMSPP